MLDVGDTVTLAAPTVVDAAGSPANADTVTLTVVLPDGTTSAEAVANPPAETGQYTHAYVITQHGRHVAKWTFTGSVPDQAYVDAFNAANPDWPSLVGLTETKEHLNYAASDTSDDEELRGFIASASAVVEDVVGVCGRRTITETNSGGEGYLRLSHIPVLGVTTVTADGDLVDSGDYTVSPSGLLARRQGCWPAGLHNIEVVYEAGRPAIPPNILDGTLELIRINWRPQAGGNYSSFDLGGADDFGVSRSTEGSLQGEIRLGFFIPNTVTQRLQPQRRSPVVL